MSNLSWTTQRALNNFPRWSRARARADSVAHVFMNSGLSFMDEILEELLRVGNNYFIEKTDLNEQAFAYILRVGQDFVFSSTEQRVGKPLWTAPTIVALSGSESITISPSNAFSFYSISKKNVFPTRLSTTLLSSSYSNTILESTSLLGLDNAVINDTGLQDLGHVYVEVTNGELFGSRLESGDAEIGKVVLTGTPIKEVDEIEEHLIFTRNTTKKSINRWKELASIEVRGIYDDATFLEVTKGMNRSVIPENEWIWMDIDGQHQLWYEVTNTTVSGGYLPYLKFQISDIASAALASQGFGSLSTEYEYGLLDTDGTFLTEEIVDIERLPFSDIIVAATASDLLFFSAKPLGLLQEKQEDSLGITALQKALLERTPDCELILDIPSNWLLPTVSLNIEISTRRVKPVRPISKTRLSVTIYDRENGTVTRTYHDWSGNILSATSSWVESNKLTGWNERRVDIDSTTLTSSTNWLGVVKLETVFDDEETETDTFLITRLSKNIDRKLSMPAGLSAKGLVVNSDQKLCVATTDNELYKVNLFYDYSLIDYEQKVIYFREEYDSVTVTA